MHNSARTSSFSDSKDDSQPYRHWMLTRNGFTFHNKRTSKPRKTNNQVLTTPGPDDHFKFGAESGRNDLRLKLSSTRQRRSKL